MPYFEDTLEKIGWGLYHNFVIFFSALSVFCSVTAIMTIPFALPIIACDFNSTKYTILLLNAMLPAGFGISTFICGTLSDVFGRKAIISVTLIVLFISSFLGGFSCESIMLGFSIYFIGISAFGNIANVKINLIEILPAKTRGFCTILIDVFTILGYIVSAFINTKMNATSAKNDEDDTYTSWRLMFGTTASLSLISLCFIGLVNANPRSLLAKKRNVEAYLLLKFMYAINKSQHADNIRLQTVDIEDLIKSIETDRLQGAETCAEMFKVIFRQINWIIKKLFSKNYRKIIILGMLIRCALFNGFLMNNIWLAKSLTKDIMDTNYSYPILDLLHLPDEESFINKCDVHVTARLFLDYFIIALSALIGLLIFSYFVDQVGRRMPLMCALIICALTSTNFIFISGYNTHLVLSAIFLTGFLISISMLDLIILENLPTALRCTGFLFTHIPQILILIISFKVMPYTLCRTIFFYKGAIAFAASMFAYFLPDLKNQPMVE